jgi:hypothetical protein
MIGEERISAKLPPGEPVAALFGFGRALREFAGRPDPRAGSDEPIALIPLSRRRAYEIALGVDYAMSVRIGLKYLRAAAAKAILRGRDRSVPELTARRRAMADLEAELLHVALSAPRRQSRFNSFEIVRAYHRLTQARGTFEFEFRSLEAMAKKREPMTIRCPVQREAALKRIAQLYGFNSARAALRYLITVRKQVREAALAIGATTQQTTAFLPDLPFVLGDRD